MDASCSECIKVRPQSKLYLNILLTDLFQGTIHAGLALGKEEMIHGLNTYVIGNRIDPRGIIVMYSDIFGLLLPNNKLIADFYSKSGEWLVYLPDFFQGDPVPLKVADLLIPVDAAKQSTLGKYTGLLASAPSFIMWLMRHKEAPTNKVCMDFLQSLRRATPKSRKIGMVGFCWGGRYAIRAGLENNMTEIDGEKVPLVDAVVALHPSNMVLPGDVEAPVVPITYGWGLEDTAVNIELKGKVEEIHAKALKSGNKLPEMEHKIYKPGRHGFAVRGNPDDPLERACLVDSATQVLNWFTRWL
jgi:dienelactone hydrolase